MTDCWIDGSEDARCSFGRFGGGGFEAILWYSLNKSDTRLSSLPNTSCKGSVIIILLLQSLQLNMYPNQKYYYYDQGGTMITGIRQ